MAEQDIKILTLSGRITHKPELFHHQDSSSLELSIAVHSNGFYAKADDPEYWDIKVLGASEKLANTLEKPPTSIPSTSPRASGSFSRSFSGTSSAAIRSSTAPPSPACSSTTASRTTPNGSAPTTPRSGRS